MWTWPVFLVKKQTHPWCTITGTNRRSFTMFWINGQRLSALKTQKCNLVEPTRSTVFLLLVSPKELVQKVSHRSLTSSARSWGKGGEKHHHHHGPHRQIKPPCNTGGPPRSSQRGTQRNLRAFRNHNPPSSKSLRLMSRARSSCEYIKFFKSFG